MDAFKIHRQLIADYRHFTEGFVDPADDRIREKLEEESAAGRQWPDPWLSLNPAFATGGSVDDLVTNGILHPDAAHIFRIKKNAGDPGASPLVFHKHQRDAIEIAATRRNYVVTTGTGSGKSLAYIVPIVDRILREGSGRSTKAIVVYPMNALANSQMEELRKFLEYGFAGRPPVTFRRYTGQESHDERQDILDSPPDILLTNYVMLDLVMTRPDERRSLIAAARGLQFLVLDELHTYRGRQGADVGMLVRRLREACNADQTLQCVGTSATMSSGGTLAQQRQDVATVASQIFGAAVSPDAVITETLVRASSTTAHDLTTLKTLVGERGALEAPQPCNTRRCIASIREHSVKPWRSIQPRKREASLPCSTIAARSSMGSNGSVVRVLYPVPGMAWIFNSAGLADLSRESARSRILGFWIRATALAGAIKSNHVAHRPYHVRLRLA